MICNIGSHVYSISFHHDNKWLPPDGFILVPKPSKRRPDRMVKRFVHGRTQCTLTQIQRDAACQIHGAAPESHTRNADGLIVPVSCTCLKTPVADGWAYCSIRDNYNARDGRKFAFRAAVRGFSRVERGLLWKEYLLHSSQHVVVRAHDTHRRVMTV